MARLARLELSDEEVERMAIELSHVLDHIEKIRELDLEGVPPTSHAVPLVNVFRDDVKAPCLGAEKALDQAPAVELQRFRVPRILDED